jgi:hypothetical protein
MGEPLQQRCDQFGIAKHRRPFLAQVGGDHHAGMRIQLGKKSEQPSV